MFESFLNPGYLLAGAALVSLPIIIHLINRMRYKRVRWAAMEFLLRSQKRNRRRLIIEQLILLALRCLLILLAVLLVSRYLGFSFAFFEPQNTLHVVVLDDSLSMSDHWREADGDAKDCFTIGKDLIVKEIARNAAQARTAQRLVLLRLSEPGTISFDQRLNDSSIQELQKNLADVEGTSLRLDLARGVEAAKAIFDRSPQDRRILHLISDFRQRDWSDPDGTTLNRAVEELTRAAVKVNLVDTAHPNRSDIQKTPLYHDNLAVVDFRPETRVAAKDMPVQFAITLANYGATERKNIRVTVKVNGSERLESSVMMTVPAGGSHSETTQVSFNQEGFNQVSANLETEEAGLQADNIRYAVVHVRKQVPVLVIDGDPTNGLRPGGDTFHLQTLLTVAKGYQVILRGIQELNQPTLDQYSCIYLLNVREIPKDPGLKNLEAYVRDGGSVAFFVGDKVNAEHYTRDLYADGKGLFPAPLADKPFPPISEPELEPDLFNRQLKLFVRNENHPLFAEVWQPNIRGVFSVLPIKRYYPVVRQKWNREPGLVEEVATLPNQHAMRDYAAGGQEIVELLGQAINDPKVEKYRPGLELHQKAIRDLLPTDQPLYMLANALDALLKDRGDPSDPKRPNLVEFWSTSEYQTLHGRIEKFRDTVQLGDPLVITRQFGKGRVVAFLTTAGRAWNDWAGGSPAEVTYPAVMVELQKYLTSGSGDANLTVGAPLELQLDSSRFDNKIHRYYQPEARDALPGGAAPRNAEGKNTGLVDLKEQVGASAAGRLTFVFDEARKPGLYLFDLTRQGDEGRPGGPVIEQRAFAFNVDPAESDLRRVAKDDLERIAPGLVKMRTLGSGWAVELANRQNDLSESAWFYLLILVILIVEQALAVHLSFHLRGGETASAPARPQAVAA